MSVVLKTKILEYKRKFYVNELIKGGLLSSAMLITAFMAVAGIEYLAWMSSTGRMVAGLSWLAIAGVVLGKYIVLPLSKLANINKPISDEQAAVLIGKYMPDVEDKLLNTLQLSSLQPEHGSLLAAAIDQKTEELKPVPFTNAIDFSLNKKYLKYALPPLALFLMVFIASPQLFTESTARIINYSVKFQPKAPFDFVLENDTLTAFSGEDYTLKLSLKGKSLPEAVYLAVGERKYKMDGGDSAGYSFTLNNLNKDLDFRFEAAGFSSAVYELEVVPRPGLLNFEAALNYPAYIGKKNEVLSNTGNLTVPEGTTISWKFKAKDTDELLFSANGEAAISAEKSLTGGSFNVNKRVLSPFNYAVQLKNEKALAKEPIMFNIEVIPDKHPEISLEQYKDSSLFNYIILGGSVSDDYGLTKLELRYNISNQALANRKVEGKRRVRISGGASQQSYLHQWPIDSLQLKPDDLLEYYMVVYDNDGVHGPKATKSAIMKFKVPSTAELEKQSDALAEASEKALDESFNKAEKLKKEVQKAKERIRGKKNLSFQDKKALEELKKKQEELQKELEKLKNDQKQLNDMQSRFSKPDEEVQKKLEALQKLMDELLDDETKQLYDQLQKLLEEKNQNVDQLQQTLEKIENKEKNLSKELDRSLELFKQLKFDQKLDKTIDRIKELAEKQEDLSKQTEKAEQDKDKNASKDDKSDKKVDKRDADKDKKDGDKSDKSDKNDKSEKGDKGDKTDKKSEDGKKEQGKKDDKGSKDKDLKAKPDSSGNKDGQKSDDKDKSKPDSADNKSGDDKNKDDKQQAGEQDPNKEKGTDDKQNQPEGANPELQQEQQKLEEELKDLEKEMQKLEEMNKELEKPSDMPDQKDEMKDAKQQMQQSRKDLKDNKKQQAAKKQKQAAEKLQKMAQQMQQMQEQEEKEEQEENADDLRKILENLLTLSFEQEALMKEFRGVSITDPRYVGLGQKQLKLKDDAVVIEDSLNALAKRVFEIKSFVTREMSLMREYMDEATGTIKQRRPDIAAGKQQLAMTSMNNLALLLNDVLNQMKDSMKQDDMMSASGKGKKKKKHKSKPSSSMMSQMQKQLNQKIEQLQKSGKTGQSLSKELAELAAQQEQLRRALKRMEQAKQQMQGNDGKKEGGLKPGSTESLQQIMEQTEKDLVNKKLTQETVQRQKEILTRLLEAENSMRERDFEEKRESKSAKEPERKIPPGFEQYLKQKEKQIEMLNTVPPALTPFYKKETNRYFKQLGGGKASL